MPVNSGHIGALHARDEFSAENVAEIQRARIIAGMVEVAPARGIANTTVAHVVECSGVSRRTFYELFDGCEDCFLAALDDVIARASERVIDTVDLETGWRERIRTALTSLLMFLEDEPSMGELLILESLAAGPRTHERRSRALAHLTSIVDEGRKEIKGSRPGPLVAESVVGGVLSVLHSRLLDRGTGGTGSLLELTGPLMSIIVLPYLGSAIAQQELARPVARGQSRPRAVSIGLLRDLQMRLTYRTVRVLTSTAAHPGCSNREIGLVSGVQDPGQISKLLARLERLGLIQNTGIGPAKGAPNVWTLTQQGWEVEQAITQQTPPVPQASFNHASPVGARIGRHHDE